MPQPTHPYVPTRDGWLYLAVVIALQSRQVLGYSVDERMPDELVLRALRNACATAELGMRTIFHSDRGSQPGFNWSSQRALRSDLTSFTKSS